MNSFTITATGEVDAISSAAYDMPTSFMQLAKITKVPIGVVTEMHRTTLNEAKFEIDKASGWWNKTMTLKGQKYGESTNNDLMKITSHTTTAASLKGYGTTSVYKLTKNAQVVVTQTLIQQQVCITTKTTGSGKIKPPPPTVMQPAYRW